MNGRRRWIISRVIAVRVSSPGAENKYLRFFKTPTPLTGTHGNMCLRFPRPRMERGGRLLYVYIIYTVRGYRLGTYNIPVPSSMICLCLPRVRVRDRIKTNIFLFFWIVGSTYYTFLQRPDSPPHSGEIPRTVYRSSRIVFDCIVIIYQNFRVP